ncbi:MAG: NADH:flavin oxidoreductase [Eggerthellaceae bacterium]|nr:NADH:flavin oxidoreductase [Eggerthellaceae bacterium]
MSVAKLFENMAIGNMTARNRIVRAATTESLATRDGDLTPELLGLYGELAWGGVGTIITGYAFVTEDGKPSEGALGIQDDSHLLRFRSLADVAHENGACIIMQLVYGGSKSKLATDDPRWDNGGRAKCPSASVGHFALPPLSQPNTTILGASSVENPRTHLVPTEATADELAVLADAFGDAAERAKACGFDGVEIHAAHGYLLSQCLSRRFNKRQDVYGGPLQNRARLARECVEAARAAVGSDYPILVKLNAWDEFDDPAGKNGGLSADESAEVAAWLVDAGASAIDVSGDWHAAAAPLEAGEPFFAEFGARLAAELPVPIIVTGGWRSPAQIEAHLERDGIAGVGLGRPFICEPDLVARWQAGDMRESACTACGFCQKHVGIPCSLRQ